MIIEDRVMCLGAIFPGPCCKQCGMRPDCLNPLAVRHPNMVHIHEVVGGLACLSMSDKVEFRDHDSPRRESIETGAIHGRVVSESLPNAQTPLAANIVSDNHMCNTVFKIWRESQH